MSDEHLNPSPDKDAQGFAHLPREISFTIAEELDLQSAVNLCRTCSALRLAGEARVWRELAITSGWDPCRPGAVIDIKLEEYRDRAAVVEKKLRAAQAGLKAYPDRASFVKTLRLEPSDGGDRAYRAGLLRDLIRLVPSITRLDILPIPAPWQDVSDTDAIDFGHAKFLGHLRNPHRLFPHLLHLKYGSDSSAPDTLPAWIFKISSLRHLDFTSAENGYNVLPDIRVKREVLSNLRSLSFGCIADEDIEDDEVEPEYPSEHLLENILKLAPNLECLRLEGFWCPSTDHSALRAMCRLKELKRLVVVHLEGAEPGQDLRTDEGIVFQRFGRYGLGIEELAVQAQGWEEAHELEFERIRLPKAAKLQRLTIITSPRIPLSEYISLGIGPIPPLTTHISSFFTSYIRRNPLLSTILFVYTPDPFPSTYVAHPVEIELFVPTHRWEAEGHRGAIIRQYRNPDGSEGKNDFWHIRALSRALDHEGVGYVAGRRCWQDMTHFRGRTVPRAVLEQVYEAAGLDIASLEGGRDLPLGEGDAAWSILREWREKAEDVEEPNDRYYGQDTSGDDDGSELAEGDEAESDSDESEGSEGYEDDDNFGGMGEFDEYWSDGMDGGYESDGMDDIGIGANWGQDW